MDDKILENFFKVIIPIMIFVVFAAVYLGSSDTENLRISNQERINKNAERKCKKKLSIAWEYLNCLADNGYKINN